MPRHQRNGATQRLSRAARRRAFLAAQQPGSARAKKKTPATSLLPGEHGCIGCDRIIDPEHRRCRLCEQAHRNRTANLGLSGGLCKRRDLRVRDVESWAGEDHSDDRDSNDVVAGGA